MQVILTIIGFLFYIVKWTSPIWGGGCLIVLLLNRFIQKIAKTNEQKIILLLIFFINMSFRFFLSQTVLPTTSMVNYPVIDFGERLSFVLLVGFVLLIWFLQFKKKEMSVKRFGVVLIVLMVLEALVAIYFINLNGIKLF